MSAGLSSVPEGGVLGDTVCPSGGMLLLPTSAARSMRAIC